MKKSLFLLPLLTFSLSACSGLNFNNSDVSDVPSKEQSSLSPNDVAIKVLNAITLFPEVGDSVDFNEYVTFDTGYEYQISDYTFTSSNADIIKVNGYAAECVGNGYATVAISGPGINQPTNLSFYVGSIAGKYIPDSARLARDELVTFEIGEANENRECSFTLNVKDGTYRNRTLKAYTCEGTYFKTGLPFLTIDFEDGDSKNFTPITEKLSMLGLNADFGIESNVYGLMAYDVEYKVCIKTIFCDELVEFYLDN